MTLSAARDVRGDIRRSLTGFASLLGSSVISAIGFVVIASRRWAVFDTELAVFIILFVQWQTLGLTIAKTGIEQVVFAVVTGDDSRYFDPRDYLFRTAMPLALLFSIAVGVVFTPWTALVAFATIVLDTYSLIVMADLNARKRFGITALSNLLNYPLFFVAIFGINCFRPLDRTSVLAVFLLSSVVRWLWMARNRTVAVNLQRSSSSISVGMGTQQALNYLMFRSDQILLALMGLRESRPADVGLYLFLAKFPELVSGVVVVAGAVYFPGMYLRYPFTLRELMRGSAQGVAVLGCYGASLVAALAVYTLLWNGPAFPRFLLVPFLVHGFCVIMANNITYSTLRQGYLRALLRNLSAAVVAGCLLAAYVQFDASLAAVAWIVPVQLMTFILLSVFLEWGQPRELHD